MFTEAAHNARHQELKSAESPTRYPAIGAGIPLDHGVPELAQNQAVITARPISFVGLGPI